MKRDTMLIGYVAIAALASGVALAAADAASGEELYIAARICLVMACIAGMVFFWRREKSPARASGFENTQYRPESSQLDFSHVAANAEALDSLREICDYLENPRKYERLGARMPRGVLLYGPPGTGKTLLARALAGEAKVPFFALNGSDFVQLYVGVGAKRVRELFRDARKAGRAVIFIDEIDALGKRRDDMASEEREQTLNALLGEMSGFRPSEGIVVVAATNRADSLDPALLRPGRFDRRIEVGLPGREERASILRLLRKDKPIAQDVDWESLAKRTISMSGASLEALMNEAAILAAKRASDQIEQNDIDRAFLFAVAGKDKAPNTDQRERATVALHEAGHALVTKLRMPASTLARVTILPSGRGAAGYNLTIPPERRLMRRDELLRQIEVLLAGRAAEALVDGMENLTGGAVNDLMKATEIASAMVMELGLAGEMYVSYAQLRRSLGGAADEAKQATVEILRTCFESATELLAQNTKALLRITQALLEKESLDGGAIDALLQE